VGTRPVLDRADERPHLSDPQAIQVGVIFGSLPERALDAWVAENPDAFRHISESIVNAFLPNLMPTAATPVIEQFANRSTLTNRPLVPASMEGSRVPVYGLHDGNSKSAR
jgi:Large polyvalent protein associated domain 38